MRFNLDGLEVFFPFERIYKEQYAYMRSLKLSLDASGHCLLEMPTGTGKTVCLLSLITSYQYAHPERGKLVYCTRTVPEMDSVMIELGVVLSYREECLNADDSSNNPSAGSADNDVNANKDVSNDDIDRDNDSGNDNGNDSRKKKKRRKKKSPGMGESKNPKGVGNTGALGLCLSSRRNMCINETVMEESDRELVDNACRKMTSSWVRSANEKEPGSVKTCNYFEAYDNEGVDTVMPSGIYDLDELRNWGRKKGWCPYYLTRRAINHANILVFNYQYMLDPKVAKMVSKELEQESIVVFDEAHNLDNICIEALSVEITSPSLDKASRSLARLSREVARMKETNASRLRQEYNSLVEGLVEQGLLPGAPGQNPPHSRQGSAAAADQRLGSMLPLSSDIVNESIPGNIRRAEHFVAFLKKLVEHLKRRLASGASLTEEGGVVSESPLRFLHHLRQDTNLEAAPLKFCYTRLSSLLRTLEVSNLDEFSYLSDVADFATLLATYREGIAKFAVIMEPGATEPRLQLACLDASLAIEPVFKRFSSVVITSGTLSPIELYPKLLKFEPTVSESFSMSTFRPCICPLIVSRGSDQTQISTRFQDRENKNIVRNYGALMVDLCDNIPDGIVAFFTSYSYLESVVLEWHKMNILDDIKKKKLIFIETKDVMETSLALSNFRKACDCGKGAVFLSVARGKVSEGINFDRHYGRAVVLFGVPFQYTKSHVLLARLEYLRAHFSIKEADFLNFDALRQASQCVGTDRVPTSSS